MLDREFIFIEFNFDDPNWKRFPQKTHDVLGLIGNELHGNRPAKAGALTCLASSRSEKIAVSKSGLDYLAAAVQRGDNITSGEVIFYKWENRKNVIILRMNVLDVAAKLTGITAREGKYGPFWLFYRDGRPEDDNDVPF